MNRLALIVSVSTFFILSIFLVACGNEVLQPNTASTIEDLDLPDHPTEIIPKEKVAPIDISGTYKIAGTNPDGSGYNCLLDITANGEVYDW